VREECAPPSLRPGPAPAPPAARSRLTLAVTLLGLATVHAVLPPHAAFVPGLDDPLTRANRSYDPRPTLDGEKELDSESLVMKYASAYGVRPEVVHAVIQKESRGNPMAVGPAGEQGLMQLMPQTAQELGVRNRFDVDENIRGGVEYLSRLLKQFGDERKALAAYHTGPGTVSKEGITPRGHAYASEILINAKTRSQSASRSQRAPGLSWGTRTP
jgi:soluble lytic murein transglycosylase-like protein